MIPVKILEDQINLLISHIDPVISDSLSELINI